jgi:hypothetical protein
MWVQIIWAELYELFVIIFLKIARLLLLLPPTTTAAGPAASMLFDLLL